MKNFKVFAAVLVVLVIIEAGSCLLKQNLGGEWTVTGANTDISANAKVPGGIFSDLMAAGVIGDIFYEDGDKKYSWVGFETWTYHKTFTVDSDLLEHETVDLVFEGLDTFATVILNNEEILQAENMFQQHVINVKKLLKPGENVLQVRFTSPISRSTELAQLQDHPIPPQCQPPEFEGICNVNQIRKMQASFAWDWGPAFASMGIWKDVTLEAYNEATIRYVIARPQRNPKNDGWTVSVGTYFGVGENGRAVGKIKIDLKTDNGVKSIEGMVDERINEYLETLKTLSVEVEDAEVKLWWPNGYGAQPLYPLNITFTTPTSQQTRPLRLGFRTIELIQDDLKVKDAQNNGLTFYFRVNNVTMYAKGSNVIPISILPEKGHNRRYIRKLFAAAKESHQNMVRVWGGGVYESDYLYDVADELGIFVWQDFMFACALYPSSAAFLGSVAEEVRHQVKRLASHPSVALWAGNNENELALMGGWFGVEDQLELYKRDYVKLYADTIKVEVERILPGVIYLTSSPTNGKESIEENYTAANPFDYRYGDVHIYNYYEDNWAYTSFPAPRFVSEYGFQSMPSVEAWRTATGDLAKLRPHDAFLQNRQHHPDGNDQNYDNVKTQMLLPDESHGNFVEAFIYFSQILQAQAIKTETEHYRTFMKRLMEDGLGFTMGALYWQLNDVWVAPTWASIDFTGRWKMLLYFARHFFHNVIVTSKLTDTDQLEVYAVADFVPGGLKGARVVLEVFKWSQFGATLSLDFPVTFQESSSILVETLDAPKLLYLAQCGSDYEIARKACFFHFLLLDSSNNTLAPPNYLFADKLKNSTLVNATVKITSIKQIDLDGKKFEIEVTSDAIALFVWLDAHEVMGTFSDNGFLQVAPKKSVEFVPEEALDLEKLKKVLTVTHLRNSIYL